MDNIDRPTLNEVKAEEAPNHVSPRCGSGECYHATHNMPCPPNPWK